MKNPQDKYNNDPIYHALVDSLYGFIRTNHLTPSEVREAAVFACVLVEQDKIQDYYVIPKQEAQNDRAN